MKKIIYSQEDIKNLQIIFTQLFPKIQHIEVTKKHGLVIIKFSITKWWLLRKLLPGLISTSIPLYELLVTQIPKQLSYRKANNITYSSSYLLQIAYVADTAPQLMCKFLKEKVDELPRLNQKTLSDILEETQDIANENLKDGNSLLERLQIFISSPEDNVLGNVMSNIFRNTQ